MRQQFSEIDKCFSICFSSCLRALTFSLIVYASLFTAAHAQTSPSPQAPVLRVNSPFAAPLWRIAVDQAEQRLVSSSSYKAVTVWSLADLNAHRILRAPLRNEQKRRAHGVAISPDGAKVAYSVPPLAEPNGTPQIGTSRVYIMQDTDGTISATIDANIPTRPQALAFSPDGRYLAAVLSTGCGVRVWRTDSWDLITSDDDGYAEGGPSSDEGCGADLDTTGVVFAAGAGNLTLITAGDTGVRTYVLEGEGFVRQQHALPDAVGLERPEGIAASPNGDAIAVGDRRSRDAERSESPIILRVAVLSVDGLEPLHAPFELNRDSAALAFPAYLDPVQVPDARLFNLPRVAWMTGGGEEWIYAGGFFACEAARPDLVMQSVQGRRDICALRWSVSRPGDEPNFLPHGTDRLMDIAVLPRRAALALATQKSISLVDPDGRIVETENGEVLEYHNNAADFRDGAMTFRVSPEGDRVLFQDYRSLPEAPVRLLFDASSLTINEEPQDSDAPIAPNQDPNILVDPTSSDPRRFRWWRNTEGPPLFFRTPLADNRQDRNDIYRSAALNLQQRFAVIGSSNFLRVVGIGSGSPRILCELPISEEAYRVNVTPDGEIIVAGHSDGVLRWYRNRIHADACQIDLVLSALITRSASGNWTWIAWTPSGEFANDTPAVNLLSWQVVENTSRVKTVDFSFLLEWYRRDVVERAIQTARGASQRDPIAVAEPSAEFKQNVEDEGNQEILTIVSRLERLDNQLFRYRVNLEQAAGWPKSLTVKTGDGVLVPMAVEPANWGPSTAAFVSRRSVYRAGLVEMTLDLPESARRSQGTISLCFYLDDRFQTCRDLQWQGPLAAPPPRRLWAVIVGFSGYDAPDMRLRYAQNDALDLAKSFVEDFQASSAGPQTAPGDFAAINIDLLVKASRPEIERELQDLGTLPYVNVRSASREGVLETLSDLARRSQREDLTGDLFLFFFSGHGFANPYATDRGRTALATPATPLQIDANAVRQTTITSHELISLIEQINAQKLVIIDACRTPPANAYKRPFEGGQLTQEFQRNGLTTSYFFSAKDGEYSLEQSDFVFDRQRPESLRGNGLFTYGLLTALHSPETDSLGSPKTPNQIDTLEVSLYLDTHIFDSNNTQSVASRLMAKRALSFSQTPIYDFARRSPAMGTRYIVLRTLR